MVETLYLLNKPILLTKITDKHLLFNGRSVQNNTAFDMICLTIPGNGFLLKRVPLMAKNATVQK